MFDHGTQHKCEHYQDATERSRNSFTFSTADQLVSWAQQRNFMIRGTQLTSLAIVMARAMNFLTP